MVNWFDFTAPPLALIIPPPPVISRGFLHLSYPLVRYPLRFLAWSTSLWGGFRQLKGTNITKLLCILWRGRMVDGFGEWGGKDCYGRRLD